MVLRLNRTGNPINRNERNNINQNWDNIERDFNNVVTVIANQAYNQVVDSAKLIWQEPVDTFGDLATTYPNAEVGWISWTREVTDGVSKAYRFDGSTWVLQQDFLGDAINEVDNRLGQQLTHLALDATKFGVTSDKADISSFLQSAIDFAHDNNIPKVIVPRNTYNLSSIINGKSNVFVDFQDSVFRCSVNQDYVGAFQLRGSVPESTAYNLSIDLLDTQSTITLASGGSNFLSGDFIFISQQEPDNSDTPSNHEKRFTSQMLEIESVSGNTITLTEPVVHNFYVSSIAKIQKITPIQNAGFENVTVDHLGTSNVVHSVYYHTTSNCVAKNIKSYNSAGMAMQIVRSRNFDISTINCYKRTDTSSGRGYTLSVGSSAFGNIELVKGHASRHTVDIANGAHTININRCFGLADKTASFGTHGQNSKKLTFSDCHVVGSAEGYHVGSTSFRSDSEISFVNCKVTKSNIGFLVAEYSYDVILSSCTAQQCVNGFNLINITRLTLDSCTARESSSLGIWFNNISNVNANNLIISGNNAKGLEVTANANSINISNLLIEGNCSNYPLLINSTVDVNISNLIMNVISTTQPLLAILNSSRSIKINNYNIKGTSVLHALYVATNCSDVQFNLGDVSAATGGDTYRFGGDLDDTTRDIKLSNSKAILNNNNNDTFKVIRALGNGITINDCDLIGGIISAGNNKAKISGNNFSGDLNIRTVSGLIFTENTGNVTTSSLPANNGTTIINQNNLLTIV